MATIGDLLEATKNSYKKLSDPLCDTSFNDFIEISSIFNDDNNHGATAYYNKKLRAVIIAHRGSVTKTDWLQTNIGIAFQVPQTLSDKSAIIFSIDILDYLKSQRLPVDCVYQTGHSKGGHEAQICTAFLTNNTQYDTYCISFNAPGINDMNSNEGAYYNHVNLRVDGVFIGDMVSLTGGSHLGKCIEISSLDYGLILSYHSISSIDCAFESNPDVISASVKKFISASKKFDTIEEIVLFLKDCQQDSDIYAKNNDFDYLNSAFSSGFRDAIVSHEKYDDIVKNDNFGSDPEFNKIKSDDLFKSFKDNKKEYLELSSVNIDKKTFILDEKIKEFSNSFKNKPCTLGVEAAPLYKV